MPKISIMVLTKDRSALFSKAIESINKQSFADFEIVVGNNGSADNTSEVINRFIGQGMPIKHLYNNPGVSITENRQRVLKACSGEYVACLDDDDVWCDVNKLKKQVAFLESHPEVVLLGAGIKQVDNNGIELGIKFRPKEDGQIRARMLLFNNFFTSTVMFRKNVAMEVGGFEFLENDYAEDYYFWLQMGLEGKMHNLQDVVTNYRVPNYSKEKTLGFYNKQKLLIKMFQNNYPHSFLAKVFVEIRKLKLKLL